jgi:hypothetical protein
MLTRSALVSVNCVLRDRTNHLPAHPRVNCVVMEHTQHCGVPRNVKFVAQALCAPGVNVVRARLAPSHLLAQPLAPFARLATTAWNSLSHQLYVRMVQVLHRDRSLQTLVLAAVLGICAGLVMKYPVPLDISHWQVKINVNHAPLECFKTRQDKAVVYLALPAPIRRREPNLTASSVQKVPFVP